MCDYKREIYKNVEANVKFNMFDGIGLVVRLFQLLKLCYYSFCN